MSYKVSFRDKTSTTINTEDGENLKALLLTKNHPPNIEINDELYRASEIISVKQAVRTQDNTYEDILDAKRQIEAKDRCRGQQSIQLEINNIANSYGYEWRDLIRNKRWREQVRNQLIEKSDHWCDYKTGSCVCEPEFISFKTRHRISKII